MLRVLTSVLVIAALGAPAEAVVGGQTPDYEAAATSARRLLGLLVAADTTNPPGNEARAVALGASRLKEAGIPYEITEFAPGRQNLVARLKGSGGGKPILLLAHVDVVGAEGQKWSTDPHAMTEVGGFLVGRGVHDDLGMAAVALEVLVMLKRAGTALKRDVIMAWTGDEESGGAGIQYILKNKPGMLEAGLAFNEGGGIVLGEDGKPRFVNLQMAEKTYEDFELRTRGPTGHSSVPLPDNAIFRLARALGRLSGYRAPVRLLPITRAYLRGRAAIEREPLAGAMRALADAKGALPEGPLQTVEEDPILSSLLRTTCVATMLSGGTRVNALPAQAMANINCRILPDESVEDLQKKLAELVGDPRVEIKPLEQPGRSEASPVEGPGPEAVRAVMAELYPGLPIVPILSRGATDSRFLRRAGVAAYGFNPIAQSEEDGRRAHGIDERFPASSLEPAVKVLHRLVLQTAAR